MKKLILLFIFVMIFISTNVMGAYYVTDPANCPTSYQSQTCSGSDVVCGASGGVTFCYDPTGILPPTVQRTTSTTNYNCQDGTCDGGFVIDCYYYDGSEPHCDRGNTGFCDRNSTCYNKHVQTDCTANLFVTSTCSANCISGYFYCDGSSTDADGCEIQAGASCGFGTGNIVNGQCYSSTAGNCTSSTRLDCNNDDSDNNPETCNGGSDGCEILIGGSCTIAGLPGTYASTCSGGAGICEISPQDIATTGQLVEWSGTDPMLWLKQYGTGAVFNFTDSNNASFFMNTSGLYWNGSLVGSGAGNASFNQSLTDSLYIAQSEEGNLNVNSSEYWDNLNTINTTQMENSGGILNILESWLFSLFYQKDEVYNKTEVDNNLSSINTTSNIRGLGFFANGDNANFSSLNMTGPITWRGNGFNTFDMSDSTKNWIINETGGWSLSVPGQTVWDIYPDPSGPQMSFGESANSWVFDFIGYISTEGLSSSQNVLFSKNLTILGYVNGIKTTTSSNGSRTFINHTVDAGTTYTNISFWRYGSDTYDYKLSRPDTPDFFFDCEDSNSPDTVGEYPCAIGNGNEGQFNIHVTYCDYRLRTMSISIETGGDAGELNATIKGTATSCSISFDGTGQSVGTNNGITTNECGDLDITGDKGDGLGVTVSETSSIVGYVVQVGYDCI